MKNTQTPNFKPENIVHNISQLTKDALIKSSQASKGNDWESVMGILDESEHFLGREMSVNSHILMR